LCRGGTKFLTINFTNNVHSTPSDENQEAKEIGQAYHSTNEYC
jgi:hypothetical protein